MNLIDLAISLAKLGFKKSGGGTFATLGGNATDNASINAALATKLGSANPWTAAANTLASGVAPTNGLNCWIMQDVGVFAMPSALVADIPFGRNGDMIVWSSSVTKWVRSAGKPFSVLVSSALTLNDAHDDCLLLCSSTPAITLGTGRMAGFGVAILGAYTLVSTGLTCPDVRKSTGDATDYSFLNQTSDTSTYRWSGAKL